MNVLLFAITLHVHKHSTVNGSFDIEKHIYDIDHIYALQIENSSESDPSSYEATKAVANISPEI